MAGTKQLRRTWPQRLTLVFVLLAAVVCFLTAAALGAGQWAIAQRQLIEIPEPSPDGPGAADPGAIVLPGASTSLPGSGEATPTTVVLAEPDAANFLVVGADTGDCDGDGAPDAVDRVDLGERSDTIMVWRANPEADQLAVLSLPRDLYVDVAGGSKARINTAYRRNDPAHLIDTIDRNFGIPVDHYVQVDFCAFRELVNAVGGVEIPFEFPARDRASGLSVPEAGCVSLDADAALAYVRSRKYQYEDPPGSGRWRTDGTSDLGRISRQQDFVRRVVAKVIDEGLTSPSVLTAMIETSRDHLVTDAGLTVQRMLEFATTLRSLDPTEIATYRVESTSETTADGSSVERPRVNGSNMQAILSVFRGEATLADAPEQTFESDDADASGSTATTTTTAPGTTVGTADDPADDAATASSASTLPEVTVTENTVGVAPSADSTCG